MFKKISWKKVLIGLSVVFVLIQFKTIDKTSPEIILENDFLEMTEAPAGVVELMHGVCYDCHSHSVRYPWYSNVAPVSWWIKGHMTNGLKKTNFAEWNAYTVEEKDSVLTRSSRLVGLKWMPIITYKITHSKARLSEEQREMLITFFDAEKAKLEELQE